MPSTGEEKFRITWRIAPGEFPLFVTRRIDRVPIVPPLLIRSSHLLRSASRHLLVAGFGLAAADSARSDTTLVYGEGASDGGAGVATHQVHVSGGKVSIANTQDRRLLIYDASADSAVIVDHEERAVYRLQREEVERMAETYLQTQRQVLADLERRIKDLPAKEQAALRSMMDVLHAGIEISVTDAGSDPESVDLSQREIVAGIEARKTEIREEEGNRIFESRWVAAPSQLKLGPVDLEALRAMDQFFANLTRGLPAGLRKELGELRFLDGRGRLIMKREGGGLGEDGATRLEVMRMDHEAIEPGWFQIPAGFEGSGSREPVSGTPEKPADP